MTKPSQADEAMAKAKKEYLPMAVGFWGIGVPLLASVFLYCRTTAQKIAVFLGALVFFLIGTLIFRAKQ
jgi:hypothetical protein